MSGTAPGARALVVEETNTVLEPVDRSPALARGKPFIKKLLSHFGIPKSRPLNSFKLPFWVMQIIGIYRV